jgi:hypothetical protein
MKLIGLTGFAGSGKDYTHAKIEKFFEGDDRTNVFRVSFADELRFEIEDLFSVNGAYVPAVWEKPYPEGIRWILQHYGTEFRRAADPNYWVDKAQITIEDLDAPGHIVVITDVRFANEADLIHELGGKVIEVRAPRSLRQVRLGGALPPSHASEEIDFPTDGVIVNSGDTLLPVELVDWMGLDGNCNGCLILDYKLCR